MIDEFATRLYGKAKWLAVLYGTIGFILGFVLGIFIYAAVGKAHPLAFPMVLVLATVAGIAIGRERAFMLRFQAQQALCQATIAWNTHEALVAWNTREVLDRERQLSAKK